jgi:hypothetical protein
MALRVVHGQLMKSIAGEWFMIYHIIPSISSHETGLHLHLHTLGSEGSSKAEVSVNGPGMIQRRS